MCAWNPGWEGDEEGASQRGGYHHAADSFSFSGEMSWWSLQKNKKDKKGLFAPRRPDRLPPFTPEDVHVGAKATMCAKEREEVASLPHVSPTDRPGAQTGKRPGKHMHTHTHTPRQDYRLFFLLPLDCLERDLGVAAEEEAVA